jgi:hypothetical protein
VRISNQVQYWLDEHTTELKVEDLLSWKVIWHYDGNAISIIERTFVCSHF